MKIILNFALAMVLIMPTALAEDRRTVILTPDNTMNIRGVIDENSMTKAQMKLSSLSKARGQKDYPIYVVLDSPGGSVIDGEDFIQFANTFRNVQTITIFAASMASAIVQAIPGSRLISERGEQMFHRAKGQFRGQFETGEVESRLLRAKALVRHMESRNATRMKIPLPYYKQLVINELWIYGEENVSKNTADEVVRIICNRPLIDLRESHSMRSLFGSITSVYSGCPLIRNPIPATEEE